jgi:hypothetical protein
MHRQDLATMEEGRLIVEESKTRSYVAEYIYPKVIEEFYTPIRKLKKFRFEFQMKSTENKSVFGSECTTNQN